MHSNDETQARQELIVILAEANATNNLPLLRETTQLLLSLCQP